MGSIGKITYVGTGDEKTPDDILRVMSRVAQKLASSGYRLRSGGGLPCELAFEDGCTLGSGAKEILIPWQGFAGRTAGMGVYLIGYSAATEAIAKKHHPAWNRCNEAAKKVHSRNVSLINGIDLKTPAKFVVCWTKNAKVSGNIALLLRVAAACGVAVRNLGDVTTLQSTMKWLEKGAPDV